MRGGWARKAIGEIGEVTYGFTGKAVLEGSFRYVRITDIDSNGELTFDEIKYVDYFEEAEKFMLNDGDLLMARTGATFAKVLHYENREPSIFASYLIRIKFNVEINNKLYWYFSKSLNYWDQANSLKSGAAQPHFNGAALKKLIFTYPESLPEQKAIVKILDEAFAKIDQAKANIEKNIENAKELFQSKLNEIFSQRNALSSSKGGEGDALSLPKGWEEKSLGEICEGFQYGSSSKSVIEGETPVLRMGNIQNFGINWLKLKFSVNENEIKKYLLKDGDVLFNRTNSPELVGKSAIYKNEMPAIFAGYLIRVRGKEGIIDNQYLNFYLNCSKTREYGYTVMSSSVNQANINASKLKDYKIRFPKIKKQIKIVQGLNQLFTELEKIKVINSKKVQHIEDLKKSLLHKAFVGELTLSEP